MSGPQRYPSHRPENSRHASQSRRWPTYLGITGLLLFILVGLAGGIIWYNSKKSSELAIAAAQRLMQEADEKITDRIRLLYDPMYAIVGIASLVPGLTTPAIKDDPSAMALLLRALRIYPQILSLYVGFDNGDFFMVTHISGEKSATLRKALQAPADAVFANEIVTGNAAGQRTVRWVFLGMDGAVVGSRDPAPRVSIPGSAPGMMWQSAAMWSSTAISTSSLRAASRVYPEPQLQGTGAGGDGSRPRHGRSGEFPAPTAHHPEQRRINLHRVRRGGGLAGPSPYDNAVRADGDDVVKPPKVADLHDPVIEGLVAAYQTGRMAGTRVYDVGGGAYIGRVGAIPPRWGAASCWR